MAPSKSGSESTPHRRQSLRTTRSSGPSSSTHGASTSNSTAIPFQALTASLKSPACDVPRPPAASPIRQTTATAFGPSLLPPSQKALGKRPEPREAPVIPSLQLSTSVDQPGRTAKDRGGRKRTKPDSEHTHSLTAPPLKDDQGVSKKKRVDHSLVYKKKLFASLRKTIELPPEDEEQEDRIEPGSRASLLKTIENEMQDVTSSYKELEQELIKAQIEESVWSNLQKETHTERTHLRYLNKKEMTSMLQQPLGARPGET